MTDADWLACEDPRALFPALAAQSSPRKRWLFACACCRTCWHLLSYPCRKAVEAVERHGDGAGNLDELTTIFGEFWPQTSALSQPGGPQAAQTVSYLGRGWRYHGYHPGQTDVTLLVEVVARSAAEALAKTIPWREARRQQCVLLREVLRNPDGEPLPIDPGWLAWNGGAVHALAVTIYDDRAFGDLPILADALEDAGCADAQLLGHCREAGPHTRGCWAVDALLGKQ